MKRTLILGISLLVAGCDGGGSPEPVALWNLDDETVDIVSGSNRLGMRLLANFAERHPQENLALSPLSLSLALGMAVQGAGGETRAELLRALRLGDSIDGANQEYRRLLETLHSDDEKVRFNIANSLWYREGFAIEPGFVADNEHHLGAAAHVADFGDPATVDIINHWVAERTEGLIDKLISPPLSSDAVLLLINALYFKADWTIPFDSASEEAFYRTDGETVTVDMMHVRWDFAYTQRNGTEMVELPYGDGRYAMSLILPPAGQDPVEWLIDFEGEALEALHENLSANDIELFLPRFSVSFPPGELRGELERIGIRRAFQSSADFGGISTERRLHVSSVVQQVLVRVNETGTEAAAGTGILIGSISEPRTLRFDRPFLFVIRERDSGTILFVGIVADPSITA